MRNFNQLDVDAAQSMINNYREEVMKRLKEFATQS
jgi:hypothetical protein